MMEERAVFIGMRFAHLRGGIAPVPGSQPLTCDGCGATDVVYAQESIDHMDTLERDAYEIICNICVVDKLEEAIQSGDPIEMDYADPSNIKDEERATVDHLMLNPRKLLELARRAKQDVIERGLL